MGQNIYAKLEKQVKQNKDIIPSFHLLGKVVSHLNNNLPIRSLTLDDEERTLLKNYPFLTAKKVIYIANISEKEINIKSNVYVQQLQKHAMKENSAIIPICIALENEIATLNKTEALEFISELGMKELGLDMLIKESFTTLNLITFITTGELETKAWTITKGMSAYEAAAKIHTDIQKGFIRAEVVSYNDMISYKGRVGAREAGKARSEGKTYIVQDGDVILFYHN